MVSQTLPRSHGSSSVPKGRSKAVKRYHQRRGPKASPVIPATVPKSSLKDQGQHHAKVQTETVINQPVASRSNHCSLKQDELAADAEIKEQINFMALPGEIRNSIYQLAFQHREVRIERLRSDRGLTHLWFNGRTWTPANVPRNPNRRTLTLRRRLSSTPSSDLELARGSAALLFTCRQLYQETCPLFYASNSFDFSTFTVLEDFLSSINPAAKSAVTSIILHHGTYGDPRETEFLRWKILHDKRWASVCWQAAEKLRNLEKLQICLQINDIPLQLNLEAEWAAPLLAFRGRNLKKVHVTLLLRGGYGLGDERLASCAKVVRRELLGANYKEGVKGRLARQDKWASKDVTTPKAFKCLKIVGV